MNVTMFDLLFEGTVYTAEDLDVAYDVLGRDE